MRKTKPDLGKGKEKEDKLLVRSQEEGHLKKGEHWGSRFGVVMAVAGSAVGLGNFLRFPGQAAQHGGGAFMVAYFVALLLIGLPLGWVEWTMGRKVGASGYHSSVGAMHYFLGGAYGKFLGAIGVMIPVIIFMYYVVIEAWCLGYAYYFFSGGIHFALAEEAAAFFRNFVGLTGDGSALFGGPTVGIFAVVTFLLNFVLIYRGISGGIELFCRYAMPGLGILAVVILVRVLTLGTPDVEVPQNNVNNGLGFLWNPTKVFLEEKGTDGKWTRLKEVVGQEEEIAREEATLAKNLAEKGGADTVRVRRVGILESLRNPDLWLAAVGQVFFSLSIGMGVILSYASYLRKSDDVVLSGLTATSANEFCEVCLGGLITVPAGVAFLGVAMVSTMSSTFGLGFHVLPLVFSKMPAGEWFGFLFFVLLFIAAVTSSISMLQPGIAFLEEALQLGRKASVSLLGFITALGAFLVLYFSGDLKLLDTLDFWAGTFLIFVFAGVQVWVFGWKWGAKNGIREANRGSILHLPEFFGWIIRFVSPAFLGVIFFLWVGANVFGIRLDGGSGEMSGYVKDLFIQPNLGAWVGIGIIGGLTGLILLLTANSRAYRQKKEKKGRK